MLSAELSSLADSDVLIMGDFNADFARGKRFDKKIGEFMIRHDFSRVVDKCNSLLPIYSNKINSAVIDHMFTNVSLTPKIAEFCVVVDVLDASDHRALSCLLSLQSDISVSDTSSQNVTKRFHRFPWKVDDFKSLYSESLMVNFSLFATSCDNLGDELGQNKLNLIHDGILEIMLKTARQAEIKYGGLSCNGVTRRTKKFCVSTPVISEISEEIKKLSKECVLNVNRLTTLKKDLRRIQRKAIYFCDKRNAKKIYTLLYENRNVFWKEVKKLRKLNAKRVSTKPSANDFVTFYKTLFSHADRPSYASHDDISRKVKEFAKSVESEPCSSSFS